jgi:REP element-mobilizing transposase RayT
MNKRADMTKLFQDFSRLNIQYWGQRFWARGYFNVKADELIKVRINEYLEHNFKHKPNDNFEVE